MSILTAGESSIAQINPVKRWSLLFIITQGCKKVGRLYRGVNKLTVSTDKCGFALYEYLRQNHPTPAQTQELQNSLLAIGIPL